MILRELFEIGQNLGLAKRFEHPIVADVQYCSAHRAFAVERLYDIVNTKLDFEKDL